MIPDGDREGRDRQGTDRQAPGRLRVQTDRPQKGRILRMLSYRCCAGSRQTAQDPWDSLVPPGIQTDRPQTETGPQIDRVPIDRVHTGTVQTDRLQTDKAQTDMLQTDRLQKDRTPRMLS